MIHAYLSNEKKIERTVRLAPSIDFEKDDDDFLDGKTLLAQEFDRTTRGRTYEVKWSYRNGIIGRLSRSQIF